MDTHDNPDNKFMAGEPVGRATLEVLRSTALWALGVGALILLLTAMSLKQAVDVAEFNTLWINVLVYFSLLVNIGVVLCCLGFGVRMLQALRGSAQLHLAIPLLWQVGLWSLLALLFLLEVLSGFISISRLG